MWPVPRIAPDMVCPLTVRNSISNSFSIAIRVSEFGIEVTPAAYLDRLDYVRILAYRLSQPEALSDVEPSQIDREGQNP